MRKKARRFPFLALGLTLSVLVAPAAVNAGSPIGSRFLIRNDASTSETEADVAYDSQRDEYLVVWTRSNGSKEIWGRRVARSGQLLGGVFRISPAGGNRYNPSVAYDSQHDRYMVVWEDGLDVKGRVISATGGFLTGEITIAVGYVGLDSATNPRVAYASTSDQYLVIWQFGGTAGSSVQAQAYDWNGAPNGSAFDVVPYRFYISEEPPEQPALAYNRSRNEFLVVWRQEFSSTDHDIWGRRVKMSGGAGALLGFIDIATAAADEVTPAVAAIPTVPNEGQYLVAWESDGDIKARTVAGNAGSKGAITTLANTFYGEYTPAAAGCESNHEFLAVWMWVPSPAPPGMMQIQGRAVALDGTLLGTETVTLGGQQTYDPAVANGPVGDMLVVFDDTDWSVYPPFRGVYGLFWGNRVFLPLAMREYP